MTLLLDTHYVIELIDTYLSGTETAVRSPVLARLSDIHVSIASLWEVAIKSRIGKLPLRVAVKEWPVLLKEAEVQLLPISAEHVLALIGPEPDTRDPFDRLLLGVCAAENMQLVTIDRAMISHPLAWRGA